MQQPHHTVHGPCPQKTCPKNQGKCELVFNTNNTYDFRCVAFLITSSEALNDNSVNWLWLLFLLFIPLILVIIFICCIIYEKKKSKVVPRQDIMSILTPQSILSINKETVQQDTLPRKEPVSKVSFSTEKSNFSTKRSKFSTLKSKLSERIYDNNFYKEDRNIDGVSVAESGIDVKKEYQESNVYDDYNSDSSQVENMF